MSAYEREQIRLKEAELALEREKAQITAYSVGVSILAAGVSILAAILVYRSARQNQADQAKAVLALQKHEAANNFQLKAAEIAMAARNAYDAKGRAVALAALFPEQLKSLGEQFKEFEAEKYNWGRDSSRELLSLIAANAEHRQIIVRAWKSLFPHDEFINKLPADL